MRHKPNCSTNISCAVYHENGICPNPKPCDCGAELPQKVSPNNISGESWEKELEEFASINEIYVRGFPMGKLKAFIHKTKIDSYQAGYLQGQNEARAHYYELVRQEAIAGERERILDRSYSVAAELVREMEQSGVQLRIKDPLHQEYLSVRPDELRHLIINSVETLLTPSPNTSKDSQCNDCFDGDHDKCSKGQCRCRHNS
jgi:hypothetical protein